MSHFVITGALGGMQQGAAAPNRIEINDLVKTTEQFSLYIQALSELHFMLHTLPDKVHLF
jgi:tyrosinase